MSKKQKELSILRHSVAHLVAHAVRELYPDTILTIGPATKDGFFYDMLPPSNFKDEDLPAIEEKMREIASRALPITHEPIPKDQARKIFAHNPFKLELIDEIPDDMVGLSKQGDFYDLCRGGHVENTNELQHFKLLSVSGSYWRADKNKQALQRISGTAFFSHAELESYQTRKQEAMTYDHRRLGKQLDLFSFHEQGVGFPFFHAKGKAIINQLVNHLRILQTHYGYQEIATPMMLTDELWRRSGHYQHYKEYMYFSHIDEKQFVIRPMNCPGAFLVYNERPRSFRELPLRLAEFGLVHRHELSGVLHGLMRLRAFTIDDAHIFCAMDQLEAEILNTIQLTYAALKRFNFKKLKIGLSTKPDNAMGSDDVWDTAIKALKNALQKADLPYTIQEGEGAFYGPKIEFKIEDSMEREWQCGTIQVDFFQGSNFDMNFIASGDTKERPVIIHRAVYGSLERFFAIILEHFKGHLPLWLAPTQIRILTITSEQTQYAQTVLDRLKSAHIRIECDNSSDQISAKIKHAQLDRIPLMIIVGNKEIDNNTVSLRFNNGEQQTGIPIESITQEVQTAIQNS